jgi:hypothetical protein
MAFFHCSHDGTLFTGIGVDKVNAAIKEAAGAK